MERMVHDDDASADAWRACAAASAHLPGPAGPGRDDDIEGEENDVNENKR